MAGHPRFTHTSKAFIVCPLLTSCARKTSFPPDWLSFSLILLLLPVNSTSMFVRLKYQTDSLKWQGFLQRQREGETSLLRPVCKAQCEKRPVSSPSAPSWSSHRVAPSKVFGAWQKHNMDALVLLLLLSSKIACLWFTWAQALEMSPQLLAVFMWNQACPDQKRHTVLWVTTATLNYLWSGPTDMAPLPSGLPKQTSDRPCGIVFASIYIHSYDFSLLCSALFSCFPFTFFVLLPFSVLDYEARNVCGKCRSFLWSLPSITLKIVPFALVCLCVWMNVLKLTVVSKTLCLGPLLWNSLWCACVALTLTCSEAGCKSQPLSNHQVVSH